MVVNSSLISFLNRYNDSANCNHVRLITPFELSVKLRQRFTIVAQQIVEAGLPLTYSSKLATLELLASTTSYDSIAAVPSSLAKLIASTITVDDDGFATFTNVMVSRLDQRLVRVCLPWNLLHPHPLHSSHQ